jgi:hypothetical protein
MTNNPRQAPFAIVGSAGTDANGNPTASVTLDGSSYTCSDGTATGAMLKLALRLLLEAGCDPGCSLTVGPNSIANIIAAA